MLKNKYYHKTEYSDFLESIGDDKIHDIILSDDVLDAEAFYRNINSILHQSDNEKTHELYLLWDNTKVRDTIESIGSESTNKDGKFTTRFIKFWRDNYEIKLDKYKVISHNNNGKDSILPFKTLLGNVYNELISSESKFYFDITNDFNWDDGEFGHEGSCWFGGQYGDSLDSLYASGGYCLRKYNLRGGGIGRVWVLPVDGVGMTLFNAYGWELKDASRVLCRLYAEYTKNQTHFRRISIKSPHYFYINGDKGVIVYEGDYKGSEDISPKYIRCSSGIIFSQKEKYDCDRCGDTHYIDDMYHVDNCYYCQDCYSMMDECHNCGEYQVDCEEIDGEYYCQSCISDMDTCENCNDKLPDGGTYDTEDDATYCESCYESILADRESEKEEEKDN